MRSKRAGGTSESAVQRIRYGERTVTIPEDRGLGWRQKEGNDGGFGAHCVVGLGCVQGRCANHEHGPRKRGLTRHKAARTKTHQRPMPAASRSAKAKEGKQRVSGL